MFLSSVVGKLTLATHRLLVLEYSSYCQVCWVFFLSNIKSPPPPHVWLERMQRICCEYGLSLLMLEADDDIVQEFRGFEAELRGHGERPAGHWGSSLPRTVWSSVWRTRVTLLPIHPQRAHSWLHVCAVALLLVLFHFPSFFLVLGLQLKNQVWGLHSSKQRSSHVWESQWARARARLRLFAFPAVS